MRWKQQYMAPDALSLTYCDHGRGAFKQINKKMFRGQFLGLLSFIQLVRQPNKKSNICLVNISTQPSINVFFVLVEPVDI